MPIISGRVAYEFADHDGATSTGTEDIKHLMLPGDRYGTVISVESAPVRVTFDGRTPAPGTGILLPLGVHFLPFARDITFASTTDEPAAVSIVWLKGTITDVTSEA
jgi:hypothetical protein